MRRVAQRMGMPVSIDIPDADNNEPFGAVFALLHDIDQRFSPYKPESEVCAIQTGRTPMTELSLEMGEVIRACEVYQKQTNGYFSPYFAGAFDPTGYVKGWAIARAGELLQQRGLSTFLINIAGDVLARSTGGHVWRIALQHPQNARRIMGTVQATNIAVATSGTTARGRHIVNPHSGQPASELLSATVIGPDIIAADVFATATCAMGKPGREFIADQTGYEALLVTTDLSAYVTAGFSMQNVQ